MSRFFTNVIRHMNNICLRGYENGKRIKRKIRFNPTLYVKSQIPTSFKTLQDAYVKPITFESMSEAKKFIVQYESVENFPIYGTTNYIHQFIAHEYPGIITWDIDLIRIHTIDIECNSDENTGFPYPEKAELPITAISIYDSISKIYFIWSTAKWSLENSIYKNVDIKINYVYCKDEIELLNGFIKYWNNEFTCPDVITGWNIRTFDIPYIINRIIKVLGEDFAKKLSPWGLIEEKTISVRKQQVQTYEISGITQLDYLDLFQKFGYSYGPQESYKLDHIANVILGESKLDYSEYKNLRTLYKENPTRFCDYNIKDTRLVAQFEDMTGLLSIALSMGYKAGTNFQEAFGTTSIWDALIHRYLLERNIVVPPIKHSIKRNFEGAFVKEVQVGMHNWVCSFDLARLYPSIIVLLNISPETVLIGDIEPNVTMDKLLNGYSTTRSDACMAATGQYFSKAKQGFLPQIIEDLNLERDIAKTKMKKAKQAFELCEKNNIEEVYQLKKEISHYSNAEQTVKIFSNSLYGSLGNRFFRYFMMEIAEGITITGQFVIKSINNAINEYLNKILNSNNYDYVLAGDTDSCYITLDQLIDKMELNSSDLNKKINFLDNVCNRIQEKALDQTFKEIVKRLNAYKPSLMMKREAIASRGIWIAKKRYILNVLDNEGVRYSEPKLKIMGIEAIKSSTPAYCRDGMKQLFKLIMNENEETVQQFIKSFREEYDQLPAESKAFPRSVSSVSKYMDKQTIFCKGTPINSRCAILYNHLIKQNNLTNQYELIMDGDKMKYIYLNPKNPIRSDAIGFLDILPPEFNLHQYIDNDIQFQKSFIDPVKMILNAINWKIEKESSLNDFFS